jgi:hypothetical protein
LLLSIIACCLSRFRQCIPLPCSTERRDRDRASRGPRMGELIRKLNDLQIPLRID